MLEDTLWIVDLLITDSEDLAISLLISPPQKIERHSDDLLFRIHGDIQQFLLDVILNFPQDYVK